DQIDRQPQAIRPAVHRTQCSPRKVAVAKEGPHLSSVPQRINTRRKSLRNKPILVVQLRSMLGRCHGVTPADLNCSRILPGSPGSRAVTTAGLLRQAGPEEIAAGPARPLRDIDRISA